MKAQNHRQRVQNGPVARRAPARRAASSSKGSKGSREAAPESGSRVLWIMMAVGGMLTIGFLLGVRAQIETHQINQAEERLRTELERAATQQKYLSIEQERALSPMETTRVGREAGLQQMSLSDGGQINALPSRPSAGAPAGPEDSLSRRAEEPATEEDEAGAIRPAARAPQIVPVRTVARVQPKTRVAAAVYAPKGATAKNVVRITRGKAAPAPMARAAAPKAAPKTAPKAAKTLKTKPATATRQVARASARR